MEGLEGCGVVGVKIWILIFVRTGTGMLLVFASSVGLVKEESFSHLHGTGTG